MGLATAKILGRDHAVVLADVRQDRLDEAHAALTELGVTATIVHCDVTDRDAVGELFDAAASVGPLASVIHTAGVSPSMGDAEFGERRVRLIEPVLANIGQHHRVIAAQNLGRRQTHAARTAGDH
ncbi:MAG: SDR family oxidoreductase [Mycolicibacter arupensis]|uniref:SDR family oxidoreductase n=1 Tax=Mycolicibacter arupensis TaxID=342002 RepID=A0A5C7XU39_9MYCO|nr:MAG: SDR family oxidoreductase [Mycolicibacter arupensis]